MKTVTLFLLLWASTTQCATSFVVKENVVFRRLTSVTTTENKWTVSLLLEIEQYPQANLVARGQWAISTHSNLQFTVVCHKQEPSTMIAKPPLSIVTLKEECAAFNEFLSLPVNSREEGNSVITETLPKSLFSEWDNKEFSVLKPIVHNFGDLKDIKIPDKIQSMKQIPMDLLIDELKNTHKEFEIRTKHTPTWVYILCTTVTVFIMIIISTAYWLTKGKRFRKAKISHPTNFRHVNKEENIRTARTVKDLETVEDLDLEFV